MICTYAAIPAGTVNYEPGFQPVSLHRSGCCGLRCGALELLVGPVDDLRAVRFSGVTFHAASEPVAVVFGVDQRALVEAMQLVLGVMEKLGRVFALGERKGIAR